jgi:putative protease
MIIRREDIELLAPVGSYESLMAAIQGGADAVYFGIGNLNMRSQSAVNFTGQDLERIVEIAKKFNLKTYLTLNTVLYGQDLENARETIDLAKEKEIDAVIVSDQAAIVHAREIEMPVHLSTQVNISNFEALRFYSSFAEVAVLARELNLTQVKNIHDLIEKHDLRGPSGNRIRIEMFVHGALCMAISGKCYLSLHEYNHSANRGKCLQVCRRSYLVEDKETGAEIEVDNEHIMSPKDLSTIHFLNKITGAGVKILKIEGRARSPEYVKTVTSCYHEALIAIEEGKYNNESILAWQEKLKTVFNRGFWNGYYLGQKLGEWSNEYGSSATRRKEYIGKSTNYFNKIGVAEFLVETGEVKTGDEILIIGPTTGVIESTVKEIRVNYSPVEKAGKGDLFSTPVDTIVRRSDKIYKVVLK